MEKILFMNSSPNRNGNTYRIGEELLKDKEHDVLQMADYKYINMVKYLKMMR